MIKSKKNEVLEMLTELKDKMENQKVTVYSYVQYEMEYLFSF